MQILSDILATLYPYSIFSIPFFAAFLYLILGKRIVRFYTQLEVSKPLIPAIIASIVLFNLISMFDYWFEKLLDATKPKTFPTDLSWDWLYYQFSFLFVHNEKTLPIWIILFLTGFLLLVCFILLYRLRYSIFEMNIVRKRKRFAVPRRVIIMGLSVPRYQADNPAPPKQIFLDRMNDLTLEQVIKDPVLSGKSDEVPKGTGYYNWQQNYRVLAHHLLNTDKADWINKQTFDIIIVPSKDGSEKYADLFKSQAEDCLERSGIGNVRFQIWETPLDYSDLEDLKEGLREVIVYVRNAPEIKAQYTDISIDTTAGQKLLSIAAASSTYASPAEFTYVETNQQDLLAFDVTASFRTPTQ